MNTGGRGDPDWAIRHQAFSALERLSAHFGATITWSEIARGFEFRGRRVHFASRAIGIFKPRQMSAALSVKSVMPKEGRKTWYSDQLAGPADPTGLVSYDLARGGEDHASNRHLQRAFERRAPLIYFRATNPGVYEVIWPVWIEHFSYREGRVLLAAQDTVAKDVSSVRAAAAVQAVGGRDPVGVVEKAPEYTLRLTRQRNHQAWFSSQTRAAYGYRCAFSGLPLRDLLVGAHIVPDAEGGPASVRNGICMSTLHHTAFDAHLIGVDPDRGVHVAPRVAKGRDGPLLESLKRLDGTELNAPKDPRAHPRREYLEQRFRTFREVAEL